MTAERLWTFPSSIVKMDVKTKDTEETLRTVFSGLTYCFCLIIPSTLYSPLIQIPIAMMIKDTNQNMEVLSTTPKYDNGCVLGEKPGINQ